MSLHDYLQGKELEKGDPPFYGLIMAAMRRADTYNLSKLQEMFPDVYEELLLRYNAPQGLLHGERNEEGWRRLEDGTLLDPDGEVVRVA